MRPFVCSLILVAVASFGATAAPARRAHRRPHHAIVRHAAAPGPVVEPPFKPTLAPQLTLAAPAPAATTEVATAPAVLVPPSAIAPPPAVVTPPAAVTPPRSLTRSPELTLKSLPQAPTREHRWDLLGGGLALFLGGYALDVGLSYGLGRDTSTSLIPLAGPLLQLRDRWGTIGPTHSGNATIDQAGNAGISVANQVIQDAAYVILSVDFVLQLAGAAMTIVGAVGHPPRRYALPRDVAWNVAPGGVRVRF